MKSKLGIGLCLVYACVIAICLAAANGADNKGEFVLKQLPVMLQMGLMPKSFYPMLENLSWLNTYLLYATPTFALLYFFGWLIDGKSRKVKSGTK
jgi:hypothetical protein